jgi:Holliday junction resolvase RusA-like endonuclease
MATANTIKCTAARLWGDSLRPKVSHVKCTKSSVSFRLVIEPEPQVRQTGRSGSYSPTAIKYNAWKLACSKVLKESLSKYKANLPLKGYVKLTVKFYVTNGRRFKVCDVSNFVKALEDAINLCSRPKDIKYPDSTEALAIWQDDRFVIAYGEGTGKYEASGVVGWIDVVIESVEPFPRVEQSS